MPSKSLVFGDPQGRRLGDVDHLPPLPAGSSQARPRQLAPRRSTQPRQRERLQRHGVVRVCRSATVTTRTRPACAPTAFATSAWAPTGPHGGSEDGGFELFDESAPSRRCSSAIRSACRATVSSNCTIRSACRRTKAASWLQDGHGSANTATRFANHDHSSRHAQHSPHQPLKSQRHQVNSYPVAP